MSAGDQQKVLEAALARIRRIAGKPDMSASVYSCLNGDQRDAVKGILKRSRVRLNMARIRIRPTVPM